MRSSWACLFDRPCRNDRVVHGVDRRLTIQARNLQSKPEKNLRYGTERGTGQNFSHADERVSTTHHGERIHATAKHEATFRVGRNHAWHLVLLYRCMILTQVAKGILGSLDSCKGIRESYARQRCSGDGIPSGGPPLFSVTQVVGV